MKKLFVCGILGVSSLMLFGCGSQVDRLTLVQENMSEKSEVYFFSDNLNLPISIASGVREDPYGYDGESNDKCEFALIIARLDNSDNEYVTVNIDGEEKQVLLEFNYRTGTHMADLEQTLTGNEVITVKFLDEEANLVCKSNDFKVDANQALEIGTENLSSFIDSLRSGNNFNGECYLKLLDNISGGFSDIFWLFSVYSADGEMQNVIISTENGSVLAGAEQNVI